MGEPEADPDDQATWQPWLQRSAERYKALLRNTPHAWLTRRIETIDTPGMALAGWRLLMMMLEHEVHHRSQIDAYVGLEGWPGEDRGREARSADRITVRRRS